jgi:dTDP-4-dehydrorhamnose reductase
MKVAILGVSGMLGSAVLETFAGFSGDVISTSRSGVAPPSRTKTKHRRFDALLNPLEEALHGLESGDYVINCIGIIKTEIDENSDQSKANATQINGIFPEKLAVYAESQGLKVIQIATDCAFSGRVGHYSEASPKDAMDHYGKTKVAGEIQSSAMMHLRVSIIGPELRGHTSLYDWVAFQPIGSKITGFTNHLWNGIPAKHFAKISRAVIESSLFASGIQHIVPRDKVTKANLVRLIAQHAKRRDLVIEDGLAPESIDRTLVTNNEFFNLKLWAAAGYPQPPSIAELVAEI